jgi:thiol-disulfide isomerase/thioredoxin
MSAILYILIGIVGLFVLLQLSAKLRARARKGKPAPSVNGQLGKSIQRGDKVLAYFYSPTCRACRTQEQNLEKIQEKFKNIIRINAAKDRDAASSFGIMGTPTTIIIDHGIIQEYFVGITPPNKIFQKLNIS